MIRNCHIIFATIGMMGGNAVNWQSLFKMQDKLDTYIADNHDLHNEDLFEESFLALLVELGELANETRCFKFWSKKGPSDDTVVLEEYVDNIHFLLSLGNHRGFNFETIDLSVEDTDRTVVFNTVFVKAIQFYNEQTEVTYQDLFKQYLQLAHVLGFSETDIKEAYHKKNEVNYERQDEGY